MSQNESLMMPSDMGVKHQQRTHNYHKIQVRPKQTIGHRRFNAEAITLRLQAQVREAIDIEQNIFCEITSKNGPPFMKSLFIFFPSIFFSEKKR